MSITAHKTRLELIWWVFTFLLVILALLPIWTHVPAFPFFWQNALMIIFFITFSRYIFLLPITLISHTKWLKLAIILCTALFLLITATSMIDFRNFMDEEGLQTLVTHLHFDKQYRMMRYIKNEMIFFGTASMITSVLLAFRMIMSLWRMKNTGRV